MKRKVKKYAGGEMVTSRGGPTNIRTRTDEEFAEDSKFGGYGRNMPKTKSYSMDDVKSGIGKLLGGKSSAAEVDNFVDSSCHIPSCESNDRIH